ncbi:MAG: hypothetical protein J7L22_06240 [Candidatus Marinimicrobia bacterium]|nr:hypothetical protein [Candidatus Neomarinimicrobiota bacterium]RKY61909.1 MAG: hypothetical protein DRP96_01765 [Candidatus Neomarinimicrobiota bacterium]
MKKLIAFFTAIILLTQLSYSQKKTITVSQKFFEVDQDIESLQKELADIRKQMRELEIRVSIPEIRKEINNLIQLPEMTHEIILNNGTVVKGKIIHEDMDRVVIQTQIGQLTLSKSSIKLTRKADLPKANCIVDGPITDEVHENKRIFKGKIKNEGIRRADFPRIIFYLYDEGTNLLASDSTIIAGNYHMYKSGVQTDATIEPGNTFNFECEVDIPEDAKVSYYIKKIKWEEFD